MNDREIIIKFEQMQKHINFNNNIELISFMKSLKKSELIDFALDYLDTDNVIEYHLPFQRHVIEKFGWDKK